MVFYLYFLYFKLFKSISINSIPQHKDTSFNGSIPTVDIEMIRNNPGIQEESPRYALAAREIKKEMAANSYLYKQNPEHFYELCEAFHEVPDFDYDYEHGLETFLDRAKSRHTRYKRRVLQHFR